MRQAFMVALAATISPVGLAAQACLGVPTTNGRFALGGSFSTTTDIKTYGADLTADLSGPVSVFGGYALVKIDDVETSGNSLGGGLAFELSVPNVSICPGAGVSYLRFHEEEAGEEATITQTVVPIGLGVGKQVTAGPELFLTLFATPQFLYIRSEIDVSGSLGSASFSDSSNEFGVDLGVRLGSSSFYGGGAVGLTTIEDSDPTFSLTLGLVLGGGSN
jgi:hypothetical protein